MDPHAVGLYIADGGFVVPPGQSAEFLPTLRRICQQEQVAALIPLVDEELLSALELERDGVAVLLPRRQFVAVCLDKFELMRHLHEKHIRAPETRLGSSDLSHLRFPIVVKPRRGRGSRGVGIARSEEELVSLLKASPCAPEQLVLQSYIEGLEFTTSVVVWRDGEIQAVVPKEIISKRGITRLAVTRRNTKIERLCYQIQEALQADGPFNVQLRLDVETGEPIPFEINPRFSTTVSLTMAAGVDEVGSLIAQALGRGKEECGVAWQEGVVLLRRSLDQFVGEAEFRARRVVYPSGIQSV
jgi:carbamoyl-phosphate synthase large subunit